MTNTPETKEKEPYLISRESYIQDMKNRWKIHTREFSEFVDDVKKFIEFLKPSVVKEIDKTKELYGKIRAKFKK